MLSLSCFPSVDLGQKAILGLSKRHLVFGCRQGARCRVSLVQNDLPSSGSALDVGTSTGPSRISVSVTSLMELVSEDLLRLNNNLKTVDEGMMAKIEPYKC